MNEKINVKKTAKRISELKRKNGLKNCDIAKVLCISESAVKNYMSGRTIPPIERLYAMAELFGVKSIEEIIVFE